MDAINAPYKVISESLFTKSQKARKIKISHELFMTAVQSGISSPVGSENADHLTKHRYLLGKKSSDAFE